MPNTTINASLVKSLWSKQLFTEVMDTIFWKDFIVEHAPEKMDQEIGNGIIVKNTDLRKEAGDTIYTQMMAKLSGAGVSGDNTLEGNEESVVFYPMSVTIDQIRHAVRLEGRMEEQKAAFNLRSAAKEALKTWLQEYIDGQFFTGLCTSPTSSRVKYGGDATAVGEIVDGDKLTSTLLMTAKRAAKMASPKIRPIKHKGKPYYLFIAHPYALRDLKAESSSPLISALESAWWRGEDNPLFRGAEIVYDGLVIYDHENIRLTTEGAGSANVAYNVLLGAGAGIWAVGKEPFWEEEDFDYHNEQGFATGMIQGFEKTVFNSQDYGVMTVITGAKAD